MKILLATYWSIPHLGGVWPLCCKLNGGWSCWEPMGDYDAVFSLGGHCLPSIQLDKNGMRPYAGPLDWMISGNQHLTSYPAFKTMLDRRITWLLEKFALASRLLLVRVGGSREQVIELDWGPERVVSMALPPEDIWNGQDELGCYMLENIRLQV